MKLSSVFVRAANLTFHRADLRCSLPETERYTDLRDIPKGEAAKRLNDYSHHQLEFSGAIGEMLENGAALRSDRTIRDLAWRLKFWLEKACVDKTASGILSKACHYSTQCTICARNLVTEELTGRGYAVSVGVKLLKRLSDEVTGR